MENEKKLAGQTLGQSENQTEENNAQQSLPVHNPLNPDDNRQITQEDIENEQKYKEALTERD